MRLSLLLLISTLVLAGCAGTQYSLRVLENEGILRVSSSQNDEFDYLVTLRNVISFAGNPNNPDTRRKVALAATSANCETAEIVSEEVVVTGTFGLGQEARNYEIGVKCV